MIKRVAVFNDLSGLGKCSLTAAIPVLACLGVQACPVPTAVLTSQTAYPAFRMHPLTELMTQCAAAWRQCGLTQLEGIYTGFLAEPEQVAVAEAFLKEYRTPQTLVVVDPVMGDNGAPYATYSDEMCQAVCRLALQADVIAPNLTEACMLLDRPPDLTLTPSQVGRMTQDLAALGPQRVVVTGVHQEDWICNVIYDRGTVATVRAHAVGTGFSGTGDLMASVVTAGLMQGKYSLRQIVQAASEFIEVSLSEAWEAGADPRGGVAFEHHLPLLWQRLL